MRRGLWLGLLLTLTGSAAAQPAPAPAPPAAAAPSPGDKCLADLPQWQSYSATLKDARDDLERKLATANAENAALRTQLAEAKKKP
jgi:Skp family chaperone for outer membrane proteins